MNIIKRCSLFVHLIIYMTMQVKKDDVRSRIIAVAHDEFIRNGVKKTSMRTIAKRSGVALGNIYKYFESKDKILCAVLAPLLHTLDEYLQFHNRTDHLTIDFLSMEQMQAEMMNRLLTLVGQFRPELKLLFFSTEGTSLDCYRDRFTEQQKQLGMEYLQMLKQKFPRLNTEVSPFLMHVVCSMWSMILSEIVQYEELGEEDIRQFFAEYFEFSTAGWQKLLKV